jgi:hypothetical protein
MADRGSGYEMGPSGPLLHVCFKTGQSDNLRKTVFRDCRRGCRRSPDGGLDRRCLFWPASAQRFCRGSHPRDRLVREHAKQTGRRHSTACERGGSVAGPHPLATDPADAGDRAGHALAVIYCVPPPAYCLRRQRPADRGAMALSTVSPGATRSKLSGAISLPICITMSRPTLE